MYLKLKFIHTAITVFQLMIFIYFIYHAPLCSLNCCLPFLLDKNHSLTSHLCQTKPKKGFYITNRPIKLYTICTYLILIYCSLKLYKENSLQLLIFSSTRILLCFLNKVYNPYNTGFWCFWIEWLEYFIKIQSSYLTSQTQKPEWLRWHECKECHLFWI